MRYSVVSIQTLCLLLLVVSHGDTFLFKLFGLGGRGYSFRGHRGMYTRGQRGYLKLSPVHYSSNRPSSGPSVQYGAPRPPSPAYGAPSNSRPSYDNSGGPNSQSHNSNNVNTQPYQASGDQVSQQTPNSYPQSSGQAQSQSSHQGNQQYNNNNNGNSYTGQDNLQSSHNSGSHGNQNGNQLQNHAIHQNGGSSVNLNYGFKPIPESQVAQQPISTATTTTTNNNNNNNYITNSEVVGPDGGQWNGGGQNSAGYSSYNNNLFQRGVAGSSAVDQNQYQSEKNQQQQQQYLTSTGVGETNQIVSAQSFSNDNRYTDFRATSKNRPSAGSYQPEIITGSNWNNNNNNELTDSWPNTNTNTIHINAPVKDSYPVSSGGEVTSQLMGNDWSGRVKESSSASFPSNSEDQRQYTNTLSGGTFVDSNYVTTNPQSSYRSYSSTSSSSTSGRTSPVLAGDVSDLLPGFVSVPGTGSNSNVFINQVRPPFPSVQTDNSLVDSSTMNTDLNQNSSPQSDVQFGEIYSGDSIVLGVSTNYIDGGFNILPDNQGDNYADNSVANSQYVEYSDEPTGTGTDTQYSKVSEGSHSRRQPQLQQQEHREEQQQQEQQRYEARDNDSEQLTSAEFQDPARESDYRINQIFPADQDLGAYDGFLVDNRLEFGQPQPDYTAYDKSPEWSGQDSVRHIDRNQNQQLLINLAERTNQIGR